VPADAELEVGTSVGRYVVLRPLGGGGKRARLFIAWDPELDRNVCLKLLSMRPDNRDYERDRILSEAQALARLSHPNVVVIYDVGTWAERVYMAMEYVEGESLRDWLRAESRTWTQVRDVIVQAGRGLAAAHAAEIVHLAVEPANIVVGADGCTRVLEFGLAQRMRSSLSLDSSADGSADSGRTAPAATVGAPAYVAPERHRGEDPDARADQFALCVTAWEAFYGQLPFAGDTRRELRGNVVRGRIADAPPSSVPDWIESALRRGLVPNPNDRWPDLHALLERLDRDPRRRRNGAIAGAVTIAVVGGGAWAWIERTNAQVELCRGGEQKLAEIWDAPTREATRLALQRTGVDYAEPTSMAVRTVLDAYAAGWVAMYTDACEATRLRGEQSESLLDRRMLCLEGRRHELQALVRVFAEADASVVERAVEAASGLTPLQPCADVDRLMANAPPVDPQLRGKHEELGQLLGQARALERSGRLDDAGVLGEQALALALELGAMREAAMSHRTLASVAEAHGDVDKAIAHVDQAVWLAERAGDDVERMYAISQLAWTLGHLKADFASGHVLVKLGLGIVDRLGGDPLERARYLSHEAVLYIDEAKYREAIELGLRAAELILGLEGEHPELAVIYNNLAAAYHVLGEAEEALRYYELARDARMRTLGGSHPEVAEVVANAASVKHTLGRLEEAEADFRSAIEILESGPGPREVFMRNLQNNFAILLQDLGRYDESVAYYRRAINGWRQVDPKQPLIGVGLSNIADLELARGRPDVAEEHAEEALEVFEGGLDPTHRYVGYAAATLGRAKLASGRPRDAVPLLRRGLAILGGSDTDAEAIAQVQVALAEALLATDGDLDEALTLAVSAERRLAGLEEPDQLAAARALVARLRSDPVDRGP
jgi:tetratricopeptide (TPR) repeat protein